MSKERSADASAELSPLKRALVAIEVLQRKLATAERARSEPIAIIGMGCRLPGGADTPDAYWRLLRDGVDAVTEIPADRWDIDAYYDSDPEAPNKMYARHGAFVGAVDGFDATFFGISPREARTMDPQQRLLLEVGYEALENAGYAPERLFDSQTGVFIGMSYSDFSRLTVDESTPLDAYVGTGSGMSIGVGRLSYVLGLHGPNIQLDTTCSSSLVTTHLACQSLRNRECDLALSGGVNLMLAPQGHMFYCKLQALAPDGRCKTFDAGANGYVRGEGCGVIALKRLSDAERDGDRVLAVIRGSAVNHDGRSNGLTAPNAPAQAAVIRRALAAAGVDAAEVDYVECHGTGTPLGDPIELQGLGAVMQGSRSHGRPLYIGSAKTNIGHLEPAAGVAGLMKVVLALHHRTIPPHLHFERPNPEIDLEQIPARVPDRALPWDAPDKVRIAGVSSFGMSGTNAHVILAEAPPRARSAPPPRSRELLVLSARTPEALRAQARRHANHLTSADEPFADVCATAATGRTHFAERLAVVAGTAAEAGSVLASFASTDAETGLHLGRAEGTRGPDPAGIAFLFTGQGAQYPGMGRGLYETEPGFRERLDTCAELLAPHLDRPLLDVLYPADGDRSALDQTRYTQPALFALEYALCGLWQSWGIQPAALLGHSLGEYVAACVAGVMPLADALRLVAERGRLMQALPESGGMVAAFAEPARVSALIDGLSEIHARRLAIAAVNAPGEAVVAGANDALGALAAALKTAGVRCKQLTVSHAFHSPLLDPMRGDFEAAAARVSFAAPRIRLVSNLTGAFLDEAPTAAYWGQQMRETVQFRAGLDTLRAQGVRVFLEIGPRPTLSALGRRCAPDEDILWLASLREDVDDWQSMLDSLGALHVRGAPVDWDALARDRGSRRAALPTYPFQRKRYWAVQRPEPPALKAQRSDRGVLGDPVHPLLGHRLPTALGATLFTARLDVATLSYLEDHRVFGEMVLPMTAYLEMALSAAQEVYGPGVTELEDISIQAPLLLSEDEPVEVQTVLEPADDGRAAFRICSPRDETRSAWQVHARGFARIDAGVSASRAAAGEDTLTALRARCGTEITSTAHYASYHQQGLHYGPAFQGMRRLLQGQHEALGEIRLGASEAAEARAYRIHPALLDSSLQALGAALGSAAEERESDAVHLPASLARFRLHRAPGTAVWSHARLERAPETPGAPVIGNIAILDENGAMVCELNGWLLLPAPRAALVQAGKRQRFAEWLYELRWLRREVAAASPDALGAAAVRWLIVADLDGCGAALARVLRARGAEVVVVSGDDLTSRAACNAWIRDALTGAPAAGLRIVCCGALANASADTDATARLASARARCAAQVVPLFQAAHALGGPAHVRLWLVTRSAQQVYDEPVEAPEQALLWGLGRGLALEAPACWGGLVDLQALGGEDASAHGHGSEPDAREAEAEALANALCAADGEDQQALRGGARHVLRLTRRAVAASESAQIRADGTYLVTGGLGALGLLTARWLAEQGAGRIVLGSRRGLDEDAAWGSAQERVRIRDRVAEIRAAGAIVDIRPIDVTDAGAMDRLFADLRQATPPLRGVFHAAGVFHPDGLAGLDAETLESQMAAKVTGAYHLHRCCRDLALDMFVTFSSISAVWGAAGMLAYGMANQYLAGLTRHRRGHGLPGLSIHWGPWAGEGMAARAGAGDWLARMGVHELPEEQALAVLGAVLRTGQAELVVARMDWQRFRPVYEARAKRPLLAEIAVPSPSAPAPAQRARTDIRERLAAADANQAARLLDTYLIELIAGVMRLDDPAALAPDQPLSEAGLDSLMAVELRNRIERDLGQSIDIAEFLQAPTLRRLRGLLAASAVAPAEAAAGLDLLTLVRNVTHETMHTVLMHIERLDEPALASLLRQLDATGEAL